MEISVRFFVRNLILRFYTNMNMLQAEDNEVGTSRQNDDANLGPNPKRQKVIV